MKKTKRGRSVWLVVVVALAILGLRIVGTDTPAAGADRNGQTVQEAEPVDIGQTQADEQVQSAQVIEETVPFETLFEALDIAAVKGVYQNISQANVEMIQTRLTELGYDVGAIDGLIGKKTIRGVAAFQYDLGHTVTGIFTDRQLNLMDIEKTLSVAVTFQSASLQYNDSVGNDWGYGFFVNGTGVSRGSTKTYVLQPEETLEITGVVTEFDKVEDTGYQTIFYTYEDLSQMGNRAETLEVLVTENRGRYSGHSALWHINYAVNCKVVLANKQ